MTREEIVEIIQQTKAEFLNEEVVKESDLETTQEQSYAKGWNACNRRWIRIFDEYLSKLQVEPTEKGMTYKENITAILECYFTGFKKEIIDSACNRILEQQPRWIPVSERLPEKMAAIS